MVLISKNHLGMQVCQLSNFEIRTRKKLTDYGWIAATRTKIAEQTGSSFSFSLSEKEFNTRSPKGYCSRQILMAFNDLGHLVEIAFTVKKFHQDPPL